MNRSFASSLIVGIAQSSWIFDWFGLAWLGFYLCCKICSKSETMIWVGFPDWKKDAATDQCLPQPKRIRKVTSEYCGLFIQTSQSIFFQLGRGGLISSFVASVFSFHDSLMEMTTKPINSWAELILKLTVARCSMQVPSDWSNSIIWAQPE